MWWPGWVGGMDISGEQMPCAQQGVVPSALQPPFPRQTVTGQRSLQTSPCPDEGLHQGWVCTVRTCTSLLGKQGNAEPSRFCPLF